MPRTPWVVAAGVVFLLSLALRTRLPLVPLGLAFPVLALAGRVPLETSWVLVAGVAPGGLLHGCLGRRSRRTGRCPGGRRRSAGCSSCAPRATASSRARWPCRSLLLVGAWLLGLAVRSLRADRGDDRVRGTADWELAATVPDSARPRRHRARAARRHRALHEHGRAAGAGGAARRSTGSPLEARQALAVIEEAGTEALEETQRLTGLLLSPHGTPLAGAAAGPGRPRRAGRGGHRGRPAGGHPRGGPAAAADPRPRRGRLPRHPGGPPEHAAAHHRRASGRRRPLPGRRAAGGGQR